MDKKTIIGLVLIFAIFIGYMWWVSPSKEEIAEQRRQDSIRFAAYQDSLKQVRIADSITAVQAAQLGLSDSAVASQQSLMARQQRLGHFGQNVGEQSLMHIQNEVFTLTLSNQGASVQEVVLKNYLTFDSMPLVLITPAEDNMNLVFSTSDNRVVNTKELTFIPYIDNEPIEAADTYTVQGDSLTVCFRAFAGAQATTQGDSTLQAVSSNNATDHYLEFRYTFYPASYEVGFDIAFHGLSTYLREDPYVDFIWKNKLNRQEKVDQGSKGSRNANKDPEKFNTNLYFKPVKDKVDNLRAGANADDKQVKTSVDWVAFKQQFFCAILMADGDDKAFENAVLSKETRSDDTAANYLCDMASTVALSYNPEGDGEANMHFYYGPSKYRDLRQMHQGFERMLPLGWGFFLTQWVSRFCIIPLFNWMERFISNYGVIIILLTFIFRIVLFPLTFKSYQSSAIMRILRPDVEKLNKKYPNQDQALQKQQEMTRLYKKAGASPMAGCLPALIQFPILIAMYRFFPASIELRQKGFLWCDDLSTYDSILDFGFNIPLYGDHISLFCLLMFGMQFFYTWYTMRDQPSQVSMPGMKFMMYIMPFFMLFIFNSQSAALNIYYFVSLCITMTQMLLIRRFTSEQKVRKRIEAYDACHTGQNQKKSKFQTRLEQLQKMNEQMQREQQRQKR